MAPQWNSRWNYCELKHHRSHVGEFISVNNWDAIAFPTSLLPPKFILLVKHPRLSWIINSDVCHCGIFETNFKHVVMLNSDCRCYNWEYTLNYFSCCFIMTVQEASIYLNKRSGFLHLSIGHKYLAGISVGLEGCRASSFRGPSGLLCWFCSLGVCNGLLIGNVCSHAEIYCCGLLSTRKSDCTGLPPSMLNNSATPQSRGQYRIRMKGNMSLICWYNKGHFRFLTNAYSPVQQGKQYSYFSSWKCTCFMSQARVSHWDW